MNRKYRALSFVLMLAFLLNILGICSFAAEENAALSQLETTFASETGEAFANDTFFEIMSEDELMASMPDGEAVTYEEVEEEKEEISHESLAGVFEALALIDDETYFSDLTEEEISLIVRELDVDLDTFRELESRGWTLGASLCYAQAVYVSDLALDELLELYPTDDACGEFVYNLLLDIPLPEEEIGISPAAIQLSGVEDPKEYMQAPYGYRFQDNESVSLNNGSLEYSVTDFVLPGLNGMDLAITRTYSSASANKQDIETGYEADSMRHVRVFVTMRARKSYSKDEGSSSYSISNKLYWESGDVYHRDYAIYVADDFIRDLKTELYVGAEIWPSDFFSGAPDISYKIQSVSINATYQQVPRALRAITGARDNHHLRQQYGLGYGWGLALPSIEVVSETNRDNRTTYSNFLHLANGGTYKISGNRIEEYTLSDLTLQQVTNQTLSLPYGGNVTYDYKLTYGDGKIAYFQAQRSGSNITSYKLVAMQDRFGNTIRYNFTTNGGVTITDTLGQTISLTKSGNTMTWNLPDGSKVIYTLDSSGQLQTVTDQEGRVTTYTHSNQSVNNYYFGDHYMDITRSFQHALLTRITHPTGAMTNYSYREAAFNTPFDGGYRKSFVLHTRTDVADKTYNQYTFNYTVNGTYISRATRTQNFNNVVTTSTFDKDGRMLTEQVAADTNTNTVFTYHATYKHLPITVTVTERGSTTRTMTTNYTYDSKGNVLTYQDPLRNTTTYTYDSNYNIPLTVSYNRQSGYAIREQSVLRTDGKAVEWERLYENNVLKSVTQYVYGDSFNNITEVRNYYGNLSVLGNFQSTHYSYTNTNTALPARYAGVFSTQVRVQGVVDADGALIASPNGAGIVQQDYRYDHFGRIIWQRGAADADDIMTFTYDKLGRLLVQTNPDGTTQRTSYNDSLNQVVFTDENGNSMRYHYTALGQILQVWDVTTNTMQISYEYDQLQRQTAELNYGPSGVQATIATTYDKSNRPLTLIVKSGSNPEIYRINYAYDNAVNANYAKVTRTVVGDSNAPNQVTTIYIDKLGHTTQEGYFLNNTEYLNVYTYDNLGNPLTYASALDRSKSVTTTRYEYDYAGRVVKETNALNQVVTYAYDELGNLTSVTDIAGGKASQPYSTTYTYNSLGLMLTQSVPFVRQGNSIINTVTQYDYDPAGRVLTQQTTNNTPGSGTTYTRTDYTYDIRGRVVETTAQGDDGDSLTSSYTYDAVGNQLSVTTGDNTVEIAYDHMGNLVERTDALGQTESFTYDAFGTLDQKTDRNGNRAEYVYDDAGRVTTERVRNAEGEQIAYTNYAYTKTNETLWIANANLRIEYGYDALGRLTREVESNGVSKTYGYDIGGNRTSFALNQGVSILNSAYTYDNLNRLTQVREGGSVVATYAYDDNSNRQTLTYNGGPTVSYEYNLANLLTSLQNKSGSTILSGYSYAYQLDGNQISKLDHEGNTTSYAYDRLGRLVEEDASDGTTIRYAYDAQSNRQTMTVNGDESYTVMYTYDQNNHLVLEEKDSGSSLETTVYSYDPNGNQLCKEREILSDPMEDGEPATDLSQGVAFLEIMEYNGYNQLVDAYVDGHEAAYSYRPDGMRHQKTVDGVLTTHLWSGQNIVAETGGDDALLATYVRGIGLLQRSEGESKLSYLHNGHGDVVQMADGSGGIVQTYDYDAFGVSKDEETGEGSEESLDTNPFRYAGEYHDLEIGIIYMRARYYNPRIGSFTAEDPARAGVNWYTYCLGNPIKYVDPSGLYYQLNDYGQWVDVPGDRSQQFLVSPLRMSRLNVGFYGTAPNYLSLPGINDYHYGVDFSGNATGVTRDVYAMGTGEVIFAGWNDTLGNVIDIRYNNVLTRDGEYVDIVVKYAHLSSEGFNAYYGQQVSVNSGALAQMGNTGSLSMEIHLHMEVIIFDQDVFDNLDYSGQGYGTFYPTRTLNQISDQYMIDPASILWNDPDRFFYTDYNDYEGWFDVNIRTGIPYRPNIR